MDNGNNKMPIGIVGSQKYKDAQRFKNKKASVMIKVIGYFNKNNQCVGCEFKEEIIDGTQSS